MTGPELESLQELEVKLGHSRRFRDLIKSRVRKYNSKGWLCESGAITVAVVMPTSASKISDINNGEIRL